MKKLMIYPLLLFFYSCNEYSWALIYPVNNGLYYLTQLENKKTGKKEEFSMSNDFPKVYITGGKFKFYKTKDEFVTYNGTMNTTLTSRSSKTRPENRDFYYTLSDSITNTIFSLKITGKWPSKTERKIEISNLIEGQYDLLKDTLIYRYNDAGCCL